MSRNRQWLVLSVLLFLLGGLIFGYKVVRLGYPPLPDVSAEVWLIQARLQMRPQDGPVRASLIVPSIPPGFLINEENFISRGFGLTVDDVPFKRRANWAIRRLKGNKTLYYRANVIPDMRRRGFARRPAYPPVPQLEEPFATALTDIVVEVRSESADTESFTSAILMRLLDESPDENVSLFLSGVNTTRERIAVAQSLLAGARIPSLQVHGITLQANVERASVKSLLAVFNGDDWLVFDAQTGHQGMPPEFMIWWTGKGDLIRVSGAHLDDLQISVRRGSASALELATKRAEKKGSLLRLVSTLQLPIQTQAVYEILLLIPFGILVIVILRNLIGLSSFGTFAPVLIALEFRETELLKGIVLFMLIVSLGLFFRFYLERLRLLLVPRLAAVVTIVVLLMTVISIISNEMGTETGLSVSLFPMIIISMIIERMSVVWEERGALISIQEGLGSLFMAALAFLVMSIDLLGYWAAVFPEVNLLVLAVIVALGRYTGFRLTELRRFGQIAHDQQRKGGA